MRLDTFLYREKDGFSVDIFPDLDSNRTLVLAFSSSRFLNHSTPFATLKKAYPNSIIAGCSSAGEIFGSTILDDSISIAVIKFDHTDLAITYSKVNAIEESEKVGQDISKFFMNRPGLRSMLVLSEGVAVDSGALFKGLNQHISENIILTGGLAGDGDKVKKTWILKEGNPESGYIAGIGFYGDKLVVGKKERDKNIISSDKENPVFGIAISCAKRRLLLGEKSHKEAENIFESLPKGSHQVGFYSYGELAPFITTTTFSEES